MMLHELKIKEMYYDRIIDGQKNFEIRFNDRDYQVGDILRLMPINDNGIIINQPPIVSEIKYIHSGLGMAEGYVVLGLDFDNEAKEEKRRCPNCLQTEPNYYCERCRP